MKPRTDRMAGSGQRQKILGQAKWASRGMQIPVVFAKSKPVKLSLRQAQTSWEPRPARPRTDQTENSGVNFHN